MASRKETETVRKFGKSLAYVAFGSVMLDALITYFLKTATGILLPVNVVLPLFLLMIVMSSGWRAVLPPRHVIIAFFVGVLGFAIGPPLVDEIGAYRYIEMTGALCAFAAGYSCMRWASEERGFVRLVTVVGGLYVIVSFMALLAVAPSLFPVVKAHWARGLMVVARPEIMTDQNFQVFYLFPAALVLILPFRVVRFGVSLALTIGGLFVLAKVQTRSGILVLSGTIVLSLIAPIWDRSLGRWKMLSMPIIFVLLFAIGINLILREGAFAIARFTEVGFQTGYGRLLSFLYLFKHIYDPLWWIPRGNSEFVEEFGTIPHSNITAMFLEGGIAGLGMWVVVFLVPLVMLTRLFFRRQLDHVGIMVLVAGLSMMIVQLSLNVPFFKQPWLWAGAVMGVLYRSRAEVASRRRSEGGMDRTAMVGVDGELAA